MAGVGVGQNKSRVNRELNMIPFIDLLMVTIAFLLITAVWASYSRVNANAQVPGIDAEETPIDEVPKVLHLYAKGNGFVLAWKQAGTVLSEAHVPRVATADGSYPDLAKKITAEWKQHGLHMDPADRTRDRCVLHIDDADDFGDIIATMDAIYAAKRQMIATSGKSEQVTAFNMVFASN